MAKQARSGEQARQSRLPRTERDRSVDAHVGSRIRLKRTIQGMTQTELGKAVGVTFQQMQKYETGANRVSASKLWALSGVLNVPVSYFFDGLADADVPAGVDPSVSDRYAAELLRAISGITDAKLRNCLLGVAKAVSGTETD
jgi:transcriptional regulator with XRE-family HTH domain